MAFLSFYLEVAPLTSPIYWSKQVLWPNSTPVGRECTCLFMGALQATWQWVEIQNEGRKVGKLIRVIQSTIPLGLKGMFPMESYFKILKVIRIC